mgnify:CR=1 FL=1
MGIVQTANSISKYMVRSKTAGFPLRAAITLTNRCNLRCIGCTVPTRENALNTELTESELRNLVIQLADQGIKIFYFFGGEPFLRRDFLDIVTCLSRDRGLFTETVTNGTLTTTAEKAKAIIDSGLSKIWFSIDGQKEAHDKFRGIDGTFEKTLRSIEVLAEARDKYKSPILIDLAVTLTRFNYHLLDYFVQIAEKYRCYEVNLRHMGVFYPEDIKSFNDTIGKKIGKEVKTENFIFSSGHESVLSKEDMPVLRENLKRILNEKHSVEIHIEPDLMKVDDWRIGKNVKSCLHIYTQICINARGSVVPCLWLDEYELGNIREQTIEEIWNGEHYQYFRENFKEMLGCSKCCYFYLNLPDNLKRAIKVAHFPFKNLLLPDKIAKSQATT